MIPPAVPAEAMAAIEAYGHECAIRGWSSHEVQQVAITHAALVAAIAKAIEAAQLDERKECRRIYEALEAARCHEPHSWAEALDLPVGGRGVVE